MPSPGLMLIILSMRRSQPGKGNLNVLWVIGHLPRFIKLCWRLFKDRRVPLYLKGMLVAVLAYVISPIDLIPDFIGPLFGIADDMTLLAVALRYFIKKSPPEAVEEHLKQTGSGE